ncbi:phosphodiester glycosidase family protein [Candidatus Acetothermia bacterium]|nr:phosphodiester glycosidase family protein [Candidatus Acetothermia bacterium]MBI3644030.1 phosphodiester glycosidase family protein [Candidatus Acetothermia bacterium]
MKSRALLIALSLALAGAGIQFSNFVVLGNITFQLRSDGVTHLNWGGEYHRVDGNTSSGRVILHYVKFSTEQLEPTVVLSGDSIGLLSPIQTMAQEKGAVVGINANFYDPNTNLPIGFLLDDGSVLNAPYSDRATLSIEFFGRLHLSNPQISLFLKTLTEEIPVQGINHLTNGNALSLYTPEYGRPNGISPDSRIAAIENGHVIWMGSGHLPNYLYAKDISWLVATGNSKSQIENLYLAEPVSISYSMTPEYFFVRDALQAGPMLLRSGTVTLLRPEGFAPEFVLRKTARSAIGITDTGEVILLVVTVGNGSKGMGLDEVASYLRDLGAVDAMALDGGGSSSLVFQQGASLRAVGGTRGVPVGLLFLPR